MVTSASNYGANHAAASRTDPAMVGWTPASGSADAMLLGEIGEIRDRSQDLGRNSGYVAGANRAFQDNIIGHQLRVNPGPVASLLGWSADAADDWARTTRAQAESWFNVPAEFDAAMGLGIRGMSNQALAGWFLDGEALALPIWRPRFGCRWNTRIQMIDPSRLDTPDFFQAQAGRGIRGGKEIGRDGEDIAFWIKITTPGDERLDPLNPALSAAFQYRRVPAFYPWGRRRVIHLYDRERVGQSRGKTIVASIMREIAMADKYPRVELQAVIANSLVSAVLESNLDQESIAALFKSGETFSSYWDGQVQDYRSRTSLKPGATLALPIGAKFTGFAPNRPNNSFDAFMESVLRNIASGISIPYEVLTKDFTKTNYSSARAALLEGWRFFMSRRAWLEENWLNPIYELWLEEAVNAGVVQAPGFYENRYAYSATKRWSMTGRGYIDPVKEPTGAKIRMETGVSNLAIECSEQGNDWMDVIDQQKIIQDYAREKGVTIGVSAPGVIDSNQQGILDSSVDPMSDPDAQEDDDEPQNTSNQVPA